MSRLKLLILFILCAFSKLNFAQEITLFQQFNGHYDYTAIGNTLNVFENNIDTSFCETLPSSQADLLISSSTTIIAAYLYWAGSGQGDLEVNLNGIEISADDVYNVDYNDPNNGLLTYFSCYAEITDFIISQGSTNTTYELSNLDISNTINNNPGYCNNRTNFAGWSIYVVFENPVLPLNQISLFQGLEIINRDVQEKTITLNNINVLDNVGAKIGFLAWEGDLDLDLGETIQMNGNILSSLPLNPSNNAFNGTNTFNNSTTFYNCDLDVYSIQNNISIGDTSAEIKLTTMADLILLNNIITVLNSQLPDATVQIDDFILECGNRNIAINYTVFNLNSTDILPENTPIAFFADNLLIGQSNTQNTLAIGESETGSITLTLPNIVPEDFILSIRVDDDGLGNSIVIETNETNNFSNTDISLIPLPEIITIEPLLSCDIGFNISEFDLTLAYNNIEVNTTNAMFFESIEDLTTQNFEILNPDNYQNTTAPQTIYIRIDDAICYTIYQFELLVENCPPHIPEVFTPNNDGFNDWFNIQGLYTIFENHKLLIYNRYGTLIFEGNDLKRWEGKANRGLNNLGESLPTGTYFYVLHLNDVNFKSLVGWVYLNK